MRTVWLLAFLFVGPAAAPARAQTPDGAPLFEKHCASCHVGAELGRVPDRKALGERTPNSILDALVGGVMAVQGAALTDPERRAIAEHLTGRPNRAL